MPNPAVGCYSATERLVYIKPDGTRFDLNAPPIRSVLSEEGFGAPPLEYVTDRGPFQNGSNPRAVYAQNRSLQVVVMWNFRSRADYWNGREQLLNLIRPNNSLNLQLQPGHLLKYQANGAKRQIDCLLQSGPGFTPSEGGWREWTIREALRFTAFDPIWYDPLQRSVAFTAAAIQQLVFPITFPITFNSFDVTQTINYDGTWQDYPQIVITGPLSNPRITNVTTGELIQLEYMLEAGRTMTINLTTGDKSVQLDDGSNLVGYLTTDSDFSTWHLAPDPEAPNGANQITVSGASADADTFAELYYYNRYFGI